jgi:cytoskeletal protein CcmA (bactofilin family)
VASRLAGLFLGAVLLCGPATASVFEHEDNLEISRLHKIDDDLYAFANRLTIDGSVTGDALLFVSNCDINGEINGSLHMFTQHGRHAGSIDGSLRAFSMETTISGYVGRSVEALGAIFDMRTGSVVGRDLNVFGSDVTVNGTVRGDAYIRANKIHIAGTIEGNARLFADTIVIAPPAVIQGDLTFHTKSESALVIEPGVTILGSRTWQPAETEEAESGFDVSSLILKISGMLAAFLFGIIVVRIFRPYATEACRQMRTRLPATIATGAVSALGLVISLLIMVLSLLGLLVGTILAGKATGAVLGAPVVIVTILLLPITSFLSVSGLIVFYSGKIIAAFVVGGALSRSSGTSLGAGRLLLGLAVLTLLFAMPYLGILVYAFTAIVGAGAIVLGIRYCQPAGHAAAVTPPSPPSPPPV